MYAFLLQDCVFDFAFPGINVDLTRLFWSVKGTQRPSAVRWISVSGRRKFLFALLVVECCTFPGFRSFFLAFFFVCQTPSLSDGDAKGGARVCGFLDDLSLRV